MAPSAVKSDGVSSEQMFILAASVSARSETYEPEGMVECGVETCERNVTSNTVVPRAYACPRPKLILPLDK